MTRFSASTGVIGALDAPEALLLGLPDERGRLRVAGRTVPLTLPARREIGAVLMPPPAGASVAGTESGPWANRGLISEYEWAAGSTWSTPVAEH